MFDLGASIHEFQPEVVKNRVVKEETSNREGTQGVPVWFPVSLSVLVFVALLSFAYGSGGVSGDAYAPYTTKELRKFVRDHGGHGGCILPLSGSQLYGVYCGPCHQDHGFGIEGVAPPLANSEWVVDVGINRLAKIIYHGVKGPIEVLGKEWSLSMPPMGKVADLSDEEIALLINYIRTNEDWGNSASRIETLDVTRALEGVRGRDLPWTEEELKALPIQ